MKQKKKKAKKQSSNRQGTKLEYKGIKFKSKLEVYCYQKLEEAGITFTYEGITYELLPQIEFKYNDKTTNTVLPLTYTPDFVGKDFIIECKGYADSRFNKLFIVCVTFK
jgi:fructose-1,6-bisphosphatase/sedoheptulose 1,7-bisphosphatase-like protein